MEEQPKSLISKSGIVLDIVLSIIFFIYMTKVCIPHVPAQTTQMQVLFGSFTAVPLTYTFWMAIQFFRVTFVDQRRRSKEGKR